MSGVSSQLNLSRTQRSIFLKILKLLSYTLSLEVYLLNSCVYNINFHKTDLPWNHLTSQPKAPKVVWRNMQMKWNWWNIICLFTAWLWGWRLSQLWWRWARWVQWDPHACVNFEWVTANRTSSVLQLQTARASLFGNLSCEKASRSYHEGVCKIYTKDIAG